MDAIEGVDGEIEEVGQKPATKESRLSDSDKHNNNGHMRKHRVNQVESNFDPVFNKNSAYSSRAQNHSHRSTYNRSKQNAKYSTEEKEPLAKILTKIENDNRDFQNRSKKSEKAETKDGEILEDGELADDNEASEKQAYAVKAHAKGSTSKSASKQANKGAKSERRKSGNWGKRNHDSDVKRRKHNYADGDDGDTFQDGKDSGPTWDSDYQMSNRSWPAFSGVEQGYGRGSKGYLSPPGLYDSPSDHSDEEMVPKALMTDGYIDASVAAFEKQGIFNRHVSMGQKKRKFEKNKQHRGAEGSFKGPPKKKSLLDMQMFERPACKFYLEGKCAKGSMCQFNHDVEKPKKMEVCKYYLTVKGCIREACQFMHHFPCKYYHTGTKCFSGDRCKFSHDPLTDATRKALEIRVAAEDIINPSNNGEHRPQEINNNPSLLGSPPQLRPDLKIIPSLFDIEVHPPGHSPKPPPSQTVRPSGFYSETNAVSVPGPINNIGLMKSVITSNLNSQQGLANQRSTGGAGLLQVPVRSGNTNSFMGSQQGLNPQHQKFAPESSVKVKNNQQPQNRHMSPVLNMLDAIIHEATLQKRSDSQSNMLPKISMGVNGMSSILNPVLADVNNADCSSMGHTKMASDNIGGNKNIQGCFSSGFTKVGNIANTKFASAMGLTSIKNMSQEKNMELNVRLNQIVSSNINALSGQQAMGQESCKSKTDLDCTNQRSLDNREESQDVCELNKIRQQIQAQLEEEDKKEASAADDKEKVQLQGDHLPSGTSDDIQEIQGLNSSNTVLEKKENSLNIPTHLPKTQQELFKRIRQQQLLQGKELDKQKVHTAVGKDTAKAETDDWYSSEEEETKLKLTDVLKKLNQEPSSQSSVSSSALGPLVTNLSKHPIMPPVASTFNIMQMINAIKGQSAVTKPPKENTETSAQPLKLSLSPMCLQGVDTAMSPASPPTVATSIMKSFGILHNVSNCQPPPLAVDPPVVNAVPLTPINYVAVRISLNMPKPYTQLFDSVVATDPAFKDDPRVKWHHSYIEKQMLKEPQREGSSDERPQKQSDPRSLKGLSDSSDRLESARSSNPQLQRTEAQLLPAVRLASGNVDPRINRQIIQSNQNGSEMFNFSSGTMAGNGLMGNYVYSVLNGHMNMASMSNMGGSNSCVNGLISDQRVGSMCNFSMDGHKRLVQGHGGSLNMIGSVDNNVSLMERPMNKVGGPIHPMHSLNMLKGPQKPLSLEGSRMFSQENTMEDPVSQASPLRTETSPIGSGVHHLSGPRLRGQEVLNEMHGNSDPRLRHKVIDPRDQRLTVNDSNLFRMSPTSDIASFSTAYEHVDYRTFTQTNNFKPFENSLLHQRATSQSLNILQSNRVSVNTHEHSNTPHCMESRIFRADRQALGGGLLPCPSFVSHSNTGVAATTFDHRSDPRFKRVKRVAGQQKGSMEYSSPLGDDRCVDVPRVGEQLSSDYDSYNRSRSGRDPCVRAVPRPHLPGTRQSFSLPISASLNVTEADPKVKNLFEAIGPTASPFC